MSDGDAEAPEGTSGRGGDAVKEDAAEEDAAEEDAAEEDAAEEDAAEEQASEEQASGTSRCLDRSDQAVQADLAVQATFFSAVSTRSIVRS
jgi:hypothetical protein